MKATNFCSNTHMTRVTKKDNIDHDKILQKELHHHITYSNPSSHHHTKPKSNPIQTQPNHTKTQIKIWWLCKETPLTCKIWWVSKGDAKLLFLKSMSSMESLAKMLEFGSKHVGRLLCSLDKVAAMGAKDAVETSIETMEILGLFWNWNNGEEREKREEKRREKREGERKKKK